MRLLEIFSMIGYALYARETTVSDETNALTEIKSFWNTIPKIIQTRESTILPAILKEEKV